MSGRLLCIISNSSIKHRDGKNAFSFDRFSHLITLSNELGSSSIFFVEFVFGMISRVNGFVSSPELSHLAPDMIPRRD